MTQTMVEHHASVVVDAPIHQVYTLFSHFNDFPKFMSFVKEVTYHDQDRSHWVVDVAGQHEWDAVNEDWIPDRQIGWHSFSGLNNYGRVIFNPVSDRQTHIDVYVNYQPPVGVLGVIGEHMGAGKRFEEALQNDLNNFAEMVRQAPANALDPNSSQYLFHSGSAAAQGKTTERQDATMSGDYSSENLAGQQGTYTSETAYPPQGTTPQPGMYMPPGETSMPNPTPASQEFVPTGSEAYAQENRPMGENMAEPVLDRDIIGEPSNIVPPEGRQTPGYAGQRNPSWQSDVAGQIPPEQMPPQRGSENEQQRP